MKPEKQIELKKLIVKRYSELCLIKSEKLHDKMKQIGWWEKEKYRIKIQYTVGCIGLGFVLACVLIVFAKAFSTQYGINTTKLSLILVLFSMILEWSVFNNIYQRKKIFKMLEIIKEE